ncbi:MAG: hypothetical protein WA277_09420 [Nitrospirota bacterium]
MEGHYHPKSERIGEHLYGQTVYIDNVPYHFEKYIPNKEELRRFKKENEGAALFSKGGFLFRLVPFAEQKPCFPCKGHVKL